MSLNNNNYLSSLKNASPSDWLNWRWQLQNRVTKLKQLALFTGQEMAASENLKKTANIYPFAITPYYLSLINFESADDPIRAQCFPNEQEMINPEQYKDDPLNEDIHMPVPKLVHRYPDRCLAIITETCATYCRHCNRKRYWSGAKAPSLKTRLKTMIDYVADSPQIREVIISGGDPLILGDDVLDNFMAALKAIPHVEILRIGSRTPVVMPMRITKQLCKILQRYRPLWFNTQFNHPQEITLASAQACNMLQEAGIPVSNQSVLLRGINDTAEVMQGLLYSLQKISVRPYYLFHCDPVRGSAHFRTDLKTGLKIMEEIWQNCSGLSLPQYVLDVPGSTGKVPLSIMSRVLKKNLLKHQHFFDKFQ